VHLWAIFAIVCVLLPAGALLDKWYRRVWGSTIRESYWPLNVVCFFVAGCLLAALLNDLWLVPIVVIPVTLFAWWRYWARDRSSQNGDC